MADKIILWAARLFVVVGPVVTLIALISGDWWLAGIWTLLTLFGALDLLRTRKSQLALADWPAERVHAEVGDLDDTTAAVRALRAADPRLSLRDALDLANRDGV